MDRNRLCPELHYRKIAGGLQLTGCYGMDGDIFLPDNIDGEKIVSIAAYTFSSADAEAKDDLVWLSENASFLSERHRIERGEVTEIHLPPYVKEVGRYAFYRCWNLHTLSLYNRIPDIGGGALNGCNHLETVEIHFGDFSKDSASPASSVSMASALNSIVAENRHEILAKFYKENTGEYFEAIFPEHYEEAVENTPARILYTSHHGSGGYYRQCFYKRALDFSKYDALLPWAIAGDAPEAVIRLVLSRLCYPYELSEQAKSAYQAHLKENIKLSVKLLLEKNNLTGFQYISNEKLWQKESLNEAIDLASKLQKTEILSFLMDERYRLFPKKGKKFIL